MNQFISKIALVVDDYDETVQLYTQKLHFALLEDTLLSDSKRWVVVAPKGSRECSLVLAKASNELQKTRVGNQTGGRVFLFYRPTSLIVNTKTLSMRELKLLGSLV